ncbi:MAG: flagellar basal-body MS-ring/collar protein FliF [Burkholderiales bacterium]
MALTQNLRAFWDELDARRRTGVLGGVVLVAVVIAAFAWWALQRDYQVLFKDMAQRDAAAVVAELKRLKVPYRLEADGTTVRVAADAVHETRLALMGRGVPLSGGVGFELFDHNDLSTTEYAQKINYQRALQGELARTIMSIEGVKLARVHLVLAEASLFKRDKSRPKASVSLLLQPGTSLDESRILGVQRLVAAAAPGLEPQMVTVVDQRGVTLSAAADATPAAAGGQLRVKKEVEEYLTRKVAEVLDRAFGPGQAIVSIDVALNSDEIRLTKQEVIPASGAGSQQAAGVMVHRREAVQRQSRPAPSLRVADGEAVNTAREDGHLSTTLETSYEVSRRVEQIVTSPGSIRRISVGIVLPRSVGREVAEQIERLVTMAAGLEIERRGDAIAVHSLDQPLPAAASNAASGAAPEQAPTARGAARPRAPHDWLADTPVTAALAVAGALGLLLGLAIALALRRSRREAALAEISRTLQAVRP